MRPPVVDSRFGIAGGRTISKITREGLFSHGGAARVGVIAAVVFVVGGGAIAIAVWLGWGTAPLGHSNGTTAAATGPSGLDLTSPQGKKNKATSVADSLSAVWCAPSDGCIAVGNEADGTKTTSLAEVKPGAQSSWDVVPTPGVSGATLVQLQAISCVGKTIHWCAAVGTVLSPVRRAVTEVYDGKSWTLLPAADVGTGDSLSGVACRTTGNCIAVGSSQKGSSQRPLIEHLSGDTWSVMRKVPASGASALSAVSCAQTCVAVGESLTGGHERPLAEELASGGSWHVMATPLPSYAKGGGTLSGLDCVAAGGANSCVAVGIQYGSSGSSSPLIEQEQSAGWSPVYVHSSQSGGASTDSFGIPGDLLAVSCASKGSCTAVGSRRVGSTKIKAIDPFVVSEANGEWFVGGKPPVHSAAASLSAVSCISRSPCEAVGSSLSKPGKIGTLVLLVGSGVTAVQPSESPGL